MPHLPEDEGWDSLQHRLRQGKHEALLHFLEAVDPRASDRMLAYRGLLQRVEDLIVQELTRTMPE